MQDCKIVRFIQHYRCVDTYAFGFAGINSVSPKSLSLLHMFLFRFISFIRTSYKQIYEEIFPLKAYKIYKRFH